jgi:hypothetical protein
MIETGLRKGRENESWSHLSWTRLCESLLFCRISKIKLVSVEAVFPVSIQRGSSRGSNSERAPDQLFRMERGWT